MNPVLCVLFIFILTRRNVPSPLPLPSYYDLWTVTVTVFLHSGILQSYYDLWIVTVIVFLHSGSSSLEKLPNM